MNAIPLDAFPLTDGVISLRPFVAGDAPVVAIVTQDDDILRWTMTDEGLTTERVEGWIAAAARDIDAGTNLRVAIIELPAGAVVGQLGLALDWETSIGEIHYWLAAAARGRGLTARAVRTLTTWAFRALGLARVEMTIDPRNEPSLAVARAAGFVEEGTLRSAHLFKGERIDTVVFSLLPTDSNST